MINHTMVNADIEIKEQKNEVKECDILLHNRYNSKKRKPFL